MNPSPTKPMHALKTSLHTPYRKSFFASSAPTQAYVLCK